MKSSHALQLRSMISLLPAMLFLAIPLSTGDAAEADPAKSWLAGWKQTSAMLEVRSGAAYYAANGVIHIIGGIGGEVVKGKVGADVAASSARMFMRSSEFARVEPGGSLSTWQYGPSLNVERGFFSAAAHGNQLYVVGGAHGPHGKTLLASVERAEIRSDGTLGPWNLEKHLLNIPRRCVKLAVIGNYLYAFGGFGGIFLDTVERAEIRDDGSLGEWLVAIDRMIAPRYIHGVVSVGSSVYMIGGHDEATGGGITEVEWSVQDEDGFFAPWSKLPPLQTGRYGLSTVLHDRFIYAIGGLSGAAYLDTIEKAQIDSEGRLSAWEFTTPLPAAREGAAAVVLGDTLYLLGGSNREGFSNEVFFATFNEQGDIGYPATAAEIARHSREREAAAKARQIEMPHEGNVIEHIKMPQYSYLHVRMDDGVEVWLAGPAQDLERGARIRFPNGAIMKNFRSNSLNRTFPFIIFISELSVVTATPSK